MGLFEKSFLRNVLRLLERKNSGEVGLFEKFVFRNVGKFLLFEKRIFIVEDDSEDKYKFDVFFFRMVLRD